jgi:hypothetical protein
MNADKLYLYFSLLTERIGRLVRCAVAISAADSIAEKLQRVRDVALHLAALHHRVQKSVLQ